MAHLIAFARDPTGTLERIARRGDVTFFRFGRIDEVLVSDPHVIEEVLVHRQRSFTKGRALQEARRVVGDGLLTSEGDVHLAHRRTLAPLFHQRAIGAYADRMVALAEDTARRWRDGDRVDLHEELMQLTLRVVAATVFDADIDGDARRFGHALGDVLATISNRTVNPWGGALYRLPLPATRRFARSRHVLDSTIATLIERRRSDGVGGTDLLSLLLAARDVDGDGGALDDRAVRDEAMTILLAGHETTAVWLTWTIAQLASTPELAERLRQEIRGVAVDRPLHVDDLPQLDLLDRTLRESLRLRPPVWLIGRRAKEDVRIGDHVLPKDVIVVMSQWVVHRDPRWFPRPLEFDPDRWADGAADDLPRFAFFPFGGGVRRCIGEGFAWMEAKLLLATLLRDWRFELTGPAPASRPRVTLRPAGGLPVVIRRASS